MLAPESTHKIFEIDNHIMIISAGIISDARVLVDQARILAQQNRVTYGSPVEPITVIGMIADRKQYFTQFAGARPYGVSLMLGGVNKNKAHLYASDVFGSFFSYKANAIGENDEKIKELLRKDFKEGMSIDEAIRFGLKIFKEILGKNFDLNRFEVGYIKIADEKLKRLQGDNLKRFAK